MTARQCIATLCLVLLLPSCVSFQPYEGHGPPIGEQKVRVTQTSGRQVVLENPRVESDEYAGIVRDNEVQSVVRIPMESVVGFEVRRYDSWTTAKAIGGVVLLAGLFYGGLIAAYWADSR